jgi:hypothetical protein
MRGHQAPKNLRPYIGNKVESDKTAEFILVATRHRTQSLGIIFAIL